MNIVLDERVSAIVDAIKKDPLVAEIIRATVQWVKEEPTKRHCHLFREVRMWLLINYEIGAPFTKRSEEHTSELQSQR